MQARRACTGESSTRRTVARKAAVAASYGGHATARRVVNVD